MDPTNAETADIERLLESSRPLPRAAFRGDLRRVLLTDASTARPGRLWLRVAACSGSGGVLLAVAALGVAGAGPLAP